jgi:hypothetical protein
MSNLTYETVLDKALTLSPEDRARLINQLTAQEHSLANGPSAPVADINSDALEYLPPQHSNADWKSPMEWLRMNRERYRGNGSDLMGGAWSRMDRKLLRFSPPCMLREFPFHSLLSFLKKPKKLGRGSSTFSETFSAALGSCESCDSG